MSLGKPIVKTNFFPTTRWSLIVQARGDKEAEAALNELCALYRRPLLGYVERHLPSPGASEDVVQEYLHDLLQRRYWAKAAPNRGKFRAFLLKDLQLFLSQWRRRGRAVKRGTRVAHLPLEAVEPVVASFQAAEAWFDHLWAREIFHQAWRRLRHDYSGAPEKARLFASLAPYLDTAGTPALYARLAGETGGSMERVYRDLRELKGRLRLHVESLVRDTVNDPSEVRGELRYLFQALCARLDRVER